LGHDLCLFIDVWYTNENEIIGNSIISANADLTPKWKLEFQLDMILYKMELLILNLDLKEIYLAGEWTSTGHLWNKCQLGFFIGIKSVLSDIKGTNEVQIHRVKYIKSNQLISAVFTHKKTKNIYMKKIIFTDKAPAPIGPLIKQYLRRDTLYVWSNHINPATGELVLDMIEAETKQVMQNMKAVLDEAGMTFENIVKTTIFIMDMNDCKINSVYATYFNENRSSS
jgi:2-iminobutanoate/2-iminopropanoate deaminase